MRIFFVSISLIVSANAFSKNIDKKTSEYEKPRLWHEGDVIEDIGTVTKIQFEGNKKQIRIEKDGISSIIVLYGENISK